MIKIFVVILLLSNYQLVSSFKQAPPEICDNAIDDDNDGLIDLNDADCSCEMVSLASIIPNPSFEDQNCCPSEHSQMRCAEAWIQPSFGTSDYMHHCGYLYESVQDTPLNEFPDGEGAIGFLAVD